MVSSNGNGRYDLVIGRYSIRQLLAIAREFLALDQGLFIGDVVRRCP